MLKPKINSGVYESREELFLARYERLMGWALHLTDGERDRAEDLLHDAFIQFTLMGPDLEHIENVDGYLRTTLRNLHLSQLRRMTQVQHLSLSIADYDSVEIGLRSMELHTQVQVRDELRQICRYACLRKETSKAGSVLILRFFHGYYPSEIAQLMGATRSVVNDLMWIARREAKLYLSDPTAVKFMPAASGSADKARKTFTEAEAPKTTGDLLAELREEIYRSRRGKCLSADQLQGIYGGGAPRAVDCLTLAHIVSCPSCLDAINRLVGLPPRSDRSPSDALGPDSRSRGGTLKSQFPANAKKQFHERCRQRLREVIEHQPRELLISVNGFILTSHHVSAEVNKQTLNVNLAERIGFIEVFSERGTRLMLLNVEPPPEGEAEQFAHLQLSDSRTLDVSVSFNGPWPTLDFSYYDPLFKSIEEIETVGPLLDSPSAQSEDTLRPQPGTRFNSRLGTSIKALWSTLVTNLRRIWRRQVQPSLWLRPMTITALIMLLLMAALLFTRWRTPISPLTAADLLQRSAVAEDTIAANRDQVVYRTINFEEKRATGSPIARRTIEIWQSAERGITARRLFDEKGLLIAGDWRRSDGVQTLYHHGSKPKLQLAPEKPESALLSFDDVWQLEPSAKEFTRVIGNSQTATIEQLASTYAISYTSGSTSGLIKATLVISRNEMRAVEQTLRIAIGGEEREYRFIEASFERHSPNGVAPSVFDPDPELLSSAKTETPNSKSARTSPAPDVRPATPVMATAELEVEVLHALNQVGADLGEQVSVTYTSVGVLRVEGIVDTEQRKREILQALSHVANNPAVRIDINTVAEALKRMPPSPKSSASITVERTEAPTNSVPVDADLRRYFSAKGLSGNALDDEVHAFVARTLTRSRRVLMHAGALKRLVEQFSGEDLRTLSPDARAKWHSIIRQHALALQQEAEGLGRELNVVFPSVSSSEGDEAEIKDDADLRRAAERLFQMCSANEQMVSSVFAISLDASSAQVIKTPRFWRSLGIVQKLAIRLQRAAQD